MRRYFFQIHGERGTDEDPTGIALSDHSAAMLRAVTMCAEIGCSGSFCLGFAVSVRDEHGAAIGRVSVVVATAASGPAEGNPKEDAGGRASLRRPSKD